MSTAAHVTVADIIDRTKSENQEYLEIKLYHAYYAFEALTDRPSGDVICGICGLVPDVLFG